MRGRYGFASFENLTYSDVLGFVDTRKVVDVATDARKAVKWWRRGSMAATAIILADDVTVIGALDDGGLLATLPSLGLAVIADVILDQVIDVLEEAAEKKDLDVGYAESTVTGDPGKFKIDDGCDPEKSGQTKAGYPNRGDSGRLGTNLRKSGCWCTEADGLGARSQQAHHIVPAAGGGDVPSIARLTAFASPPQTLFGRKRVLARSFTGGRLVHRTTQPCLKTVIQMPE